jgi:hypothetical protein
MLKDLKKYLFLVMRWIEGYEGAAFQGYSQRKLSVASV